MKPILNQNDVKGLAALVRCVWFLAVTGGCYIKEGNVDLDHAEAVSLIVESKAEKALKKVNSYLKNEDS